MAWIYLIVAGLLEIIWATALKYTEGFTRLGPSALTIAAATASFGFPAIAYGVGYRPYGELIYEVDGRWRE